MLVGGKKQIEHFYIFYIESASAANIGEYGLELTRPIGVSLRTDFECARRKHVLKKVIFQNNVSTFIN